MAQGSALRARASHGIAIPAKTSTALLKFGKPMSFPEKRLCGHVVRRIFHLVRGLLRRAVMEAIDMRQTHNSPSLAQSAAKLFVPIDSLRREIATRPDPERRLRLAVLEGAVRDFQRHLGSTDAHGRRLHQETADWFACVDRTQPFAFESVCAALGIDAEALRRGLNHWRATEFVLGARQWLERRTPSSRRHAA